LPNWSETQVELTFKNKNQAKKVKSKVKNFGFNFGQTKETPNNKDWYDWNLKHWGTKWNTKPNTDINISNKTIMVNFDCAWNGPIEWFKTLAKQHKATGYYFDREVGNDYSYLVEVVNGEVVSEVEDTYYTKLVLDLGICDRVSMLNSILWVTQEDDWENNSVLKHTAEVLDEDVKDIIKELKDDFI
jgi:hypothetical protein